MTYDIDSWVTDFETFLKANLNGKITALNTEKGDAPQLLTIADGAYFFQTLNDKIANFNPFIFYGINDIEPGPIGPAMSEKYLIDLIVVVVDVGQDLLIGKRLLRYNRALKDLIQSNWSSIGDGNKLKVRTLVPVAFKLANTSNEYRAIGITIEVNFA